MKVLTPKTHSSQDSTNSNYFALLFPFGPAEKKIFEFQLDFEN
jgi:hypothetical protein